MKYEVSIGYQTFVFDDAVEAFQFAQTAKRTFKHGVVDVEVRLVAEDETEEAEI